MELEHYDWTGLICRYLRGYAAGVGRPKGERAANSPVVNTNTNTKPVLKRKPKTSEQTKPNNGEGHPAIHFAFQAFQAKYGRPPAWDRSHYAPVHELFKKQAWLTLEEFQRRWTNYMNSTDSFTASSGHYLRFFVTQFDRYAEAQHGTGKATQASLPGTSNVGGKDSAKGSGDAGGGSGSSPGKYAKYFSLDRS